MDFFRPKDGLESAHGSIGGAAWIERDTITSRYWKEVKSNAESRPASREIPSWLCHSLSVEERLRLF
jgi:hypothetical protein